MFRAVAARSSIVFLLSVQSLAAQDRQFDVPPNTSKKPSEILSTIEQRADFSYLEEMSWNDRGHYAVTYHTSDKARVEMKIDAVTGLPTD